MRLVARTIAAGMLLAFTGEGAAQAADCFDTEAGILLASCTAPTTAELRLVDENGIEPDMPEDAERLLAVTGSYTSGEKREPEGLFILGGEALDPHPQGWDGLALIDARGRLTVHHVERIMAGDDLWNLREGWSRKAFVKASKALGWSAFQSHLLVVDGKVDTRARDNAPRFKRRLLFTREDGTFGLYETAPLTLHDAALDIAERFAPVMALNLDMGSYNYCRDLSGSDARDCGVLGDDYTDKLSNIIVFRQTKSPDARTAQSETPAR